MNEQLIEKVTEYVDQLAVSLGVAAEHVYVVMARQMSVEGIVYSALYLTLIIGLPIVVVKLAKLTIRKWDDIYKYDIDAIVLAMWILGGIVSAINITGSILSLPDALMKVGNPEYYVIREILDIFGGGAK